MNRIEALRLAEEIICGQRQEAYGDAKRNFSTIATMWSAYLGREVSPLDVANMMILLKVARGKNMQRHMDNWIDVIGYSALGAEMVDELSMSVDLPPMPSEQAH